MWLILALLLNSSLVVMAGATIPPCLPGMSEAFRGSPGVAILVPLVLTTPALFIAAAAPLAGFLVDSTGRKPLLLLGLLLFILAGSSGLWLETLPSILAGRAAVGIAVALIMTATTSLIGDHFEGHERRRLIGAQAAFMSFSGVLFVLAGGWLADLNWRAPFAVYLAAVPVLFLSWWVVCDRTSTRVPPGSPRRGRHSIRWFTVMVVYSLAVVGMALFYLIPVQLPFYLARLTGGSAWSTGVAISFATLTSAVVSLSYSGVRRRFGFEAIMGLLFSMIGVGYVLLSFSESLSGVFFSMVVAGSGLGMLLPNLTLWMTELAPESIRGRVVGGLTSFIFLGQFLSPILVQPLVSKWGYEGLPGAFGICGIASIAVGGIFLLFRLPGSSHGITA